jgi:hypothetical protein
MEIKLHLAIGVFSFHLQGLILYLKKKRLGHGIEVKLNIKKAQEKMLIFKPEK